MKDYRVTVKVRNNRLLKAIEDAGGTPGMKWCEANGLRYDKVNDLINMTCSPLTAKGELCLEAAKLCDVVNKLPDELWSKQQLYPLEKNFSELEMDHTQVLAHLSISKEQSYLPDFSGLEQIQARALIEKALDTVSTRERNVILLLFMKECSLDDVAGRLGVTVERAQQIRDRALKKMRRPQTLAMLIDCAPEMVGADRHAEIKPASPAITRAAWESARSRALSGCDGSSG